MEALNQKTRRIKLQEELEVLLESKNVYFQPNESVKLHYDCVIYSIDTVNLTYADNSAYKGRRRYTLLVITRKPDSDLAERITRHFPYCSVNRVYAADNLTHTALTLYW